MSSVMCLPIVLYLSWNFVRDNIAIFETVRYDEKQCRTPSRGTGMKTNH